MNRTTALLRTVLVVAATAAASVPVALGVIPPLTVLADAAGQGRAGVGAVTLPEAVSGLCATALGGCYAVWVLGLLLALVEALPHGPARAAVRRVPCPRLARTLAVMALGVSLAVSAPASADGPQDARRAAPAGAPATGLGPGAALTGLPLPDRVPTPVRARPGVTAPATHRVVPGDTLWSIAAATLPPGAPGAAVDRAWRRIAAANPGVVTDPDLIFPGTVLRVPPVHDLLGKDQP